MRVAVKRITPREAQIIPISTEFIRLDTALKLANAVPTGGAAKQLIQQGEAQVNGEVCIQRGKKLRPGDQVAFLGQVYRIESHDA